MNENEIKQTTEDTAVSRRKVTKADFYAQSMTTKGKIAYWSKTSVYLLLSSLLLAIAIHCLISANDFVVGGIAGIAILINALTGGLVQQSVLVFCINLPLIILSFFFVKKKFAILSSANILLQSLWLFILETFFPDFQIIFAAGSERIFAAIGGGLCIGAAVALAIKIGGSTGGLDILAVMVQKKLKSVSFPWVLFALNCIIFFSSVFVYNTTETNLAVRLLPIILSAFESYVESKVNESITNGFQSAIEFRIITDKPEEMAQALMQGLSRGVTSVPAQGMFTKEHHSMLICVVSRRQVAALRQIMKAVDPDSFAVMSAVSQVLGLGFYSAE